MSARKLFPNFHGILSGELAQYFTAKTKLIEAQQQVREIERRLKLLGIDPTWSLADALSADPEEVFVCEHEGCERPVISRSWAQKEFCGEHTPAKKPDPGPVVLAGEEIGF